MKTMFRFPLVALATGFLFVSILAQAQKTTSAKPPRYKDVVVENPNAERDMKIVGDFVNALVTGNQKKARSLLSPTFMGHGPAPTDSANIDKTLKEWAANYKTQMNRKVGFVTTTWQVKSGPYKGTWVSLWGTYSFTQAGKTVSFPFQYTASVSDGTIKSDRVYYDRLYILEQLGFKVTPPQLAKK